MTERNETTGIRRAAIGRRMLQGAAIALALISLYLIFIGTGKPGWNPIWRLRPLTIVPIAGAIGGIWVYLMDSLRIQGGWKAALAIFLSALGYLVAIWLGTVLGLAGTYWH